jgi:hypothetical protein
VYRVCFLSTVFASQLGLMISKVGVTASYLLCPSLILFMCVFVIMTEHAAKTCVRICNAVFNVGVGLNKERIKGKRQNVFCKTDEKLLNTEKIMVSYCAFLGQIHFVINVLLSNFLCPWNYRIRYANLCIMPFP